MKEHQLLMEINDIMLNYDIDYGFDQYVFIDILKELSLIARKYFDQNTLYTDMLYNQARTLDTETQCKVFYDVFILIKNDPTILKGTQEEKTHIIAQLIFDELLKITTLGIKSQLWILGIISTITLTIVGSILILHLINMYAT